MTSSTTRVTPDSGSPAGRVRATIGRDEGAAAVEFALILPLFVVMMFGLIDFGHLFFVKSVITSAAREGARYGAVKVPPAGTTDVAGWTTAAATYQANLYLSYAGLSAGYSGTLGSVSANCGQICPTVTAELVTGPTGVASEVLKVTVKIAGTYPNLTGFSYGILSNSTNPFSRIQDLKSISEMRLESAPP